jgi:hypothetical protein
MEILEMSGLALRATRAAEPTRPVAPVRMMCMVEFGFKSVNGFEKV